MTEQKMDVVRFPPLVLLFSMVDNVLARTFTITVLAEDGLFNLEEDGMSFLFAQDGGQCSKYEIRCRASPPPSLVRDITLSRVGRCFFRFFFFRVQNV